MNVSPFVFKTRAMRALKGNWQTALLVSFFASLPMTLLQLVQQTRLPDLTRARDYEAMAALIQAIPDATWTLLALVSIFSLLLTPVLAIGCNAYFIERLQGREPGFKGLFSRMGAAGKALLLYALIALKVFLWSLLLVVPGIIAVLRYSMAPFYLAEHPEIGVLEALRRSKETMKDKKMTYLVLQLSFLWWLLGALVSEWFLSAIHPILGMVVSLFIQLFMAAYLNAACAGFYLAGTVPDGMTRAQTEATRWLRSMMDKRDAGGVYRRPFGNDDAEDSADGSPEDDETDPDAEDGTNADGMNEDGTYNQDPPAPDSETAAKPDGEASPASDTEPDIKPDAPAGRDGGENP